MQTSLVVFTFQYVFFVSNIDVLFFTFPISMLNTPIKNKTYSPICTREALDTHFVKHFLD